MFSILYVDDEPGLLEIGKMFLEQGGRFSVETITSAAEALEILRTEHYDAIISDYQMPVMDGIEFLKRVRASGNTIPFIIFTGRGREEIVIQALNEGADFYLQKGGEPLSQFAELAHKIRQAVQQRMAEASIRDHERREADIINFLPDATFAIDQTGHVIAWNRAIEEMTGTPASEMLGKGDYAYAIPFYGERRPMLIDLIYESDEVIAEKYSYIIHEKNVLIAQTTLPRPKGKPVTLMGKASPLYNRQGEIIGAIESIRDITQMKNAEVRVRESEEQFSAFMDRLPVTAFIKDDQSTNLFVNRNMREIFGSGEWVGKSVRELFPREAAEKMIEDDRQTLREGYRKAIEPLRGKDGKLRIYETIKFRIDRENKPPLIGGFASDITDRKEAEDALQASEKRFRELADLLPQVVFETDADGNLIYTNRIAFDQFGYTSEDFRHGLNIQQMIAPGDRKRAGVSFHTQITEPEKTRAAEEYMALRKDGSTFPFAIYSSAIVADARITGLRGIIVDITERKRAEAEMRSSRNLMQSIFDAVPDLLIVVDRQYRILYSNFKGHDRIKQVDPEMCTTCYGRFKLLSEPCEDCSALPVFENGETVQKEMVNPADGRIREVRAFPIFDASGTVSMVVEYVRDITERKRAEDTVRESEQKYRTVFETTGTATVLIENDGMISLANSEFARLSGYPKDEIESRKKWTEFVVKEDLDRMLAQHRMRRQDPPSALSHYEFRFTTRSGEIRDIYLTIDVIPGTTKSVASLLDITERKQAENAIRESEQRYRNVVEDQTEFISRFLPDGTHVFVNEAYCRYFGLKRDEILGHRFRPQIPAEDQEKVRSFFASLTPEHTVDIVVHRIIMPDGAIRWQRWSDRAIFDPDGTLREYQSVGRDITETKEAEFALQASEERYRLIADNTADHIWIFDMDMNLKYTSPSVMKMKGFSVEEVLSQSLEEMMTPASVESVLRRFQEEMALEAGGTADPDRTISFETEEYCKDGSTIMVENAVTLMRDPEGRPVSILGISRNITARKSADQALRESEDRYRKLVEISPDTILVHQEGRIVFMNPAGLELLGAVHAGQVVGRPVLDFIHTESRETIRTNIDKDLTGERTPLIELCMLRLDGEILTVEGQGVQTLYQGKPAIQVAIRDITERNRVELALRESEDRLRTIMQSVQTGIVIIDARTHTILDVNRKALAMIGVKKADIIGSVCHRFICPCEQGECPITDLGQGADASERVLLTKSGVRIPVLKTVVPATIAGRDVFIESVMDISELKSREDRIRILAGLLDLIPASVTVHDTEGRFLYANEKSFEFHGYTAGEFSKINLHELDVPESERLIEERIRQLKETGHVSFEVQHYRKDGSVIPLLVNARITTWDGAPVILSIATDNTERKQAEQELVAAYQEYQNLLDQIQDVYYRSDKEGRLIRISRSLTDLLGYRDISELLGKNIAEEFYLNIGDRTRLLEEITRKGKVTNYEVQLRRKDGTPVTISASSHLWYQPDGTIGGVEGSFRDITVQKQAEDALRESELLLREIFDNANDAVFLLERYPDGPGKYLLVNDKAVRMLGYSREELLTMSPRDIVPEDIARKVMPGVIQNLLRDGHATFESAHRRKDGSVYPIEVSTHTFHYQGKDVDLSIVRDITERKRSERIIQETNKKINLLSSITRHDVTNQVSILKGYAKIALAKKPDPVVADFLAKIDTAGSTIARQIEFAREYQELGMQAPGWQRIRDIVAQQQTKEGISLSCSCDAEVFADPMLERVFFNLIDNAVRHGETVTAIRVSCQQDPDGLLIVIGDDGVGVPPGLKEKIFEKGYGKHTGFGLFLAREILAITGIIILETGSHGKGARFEIIVPKGMYRLVS